MPKEWQKIFLTTFICIIKKASFLDYSEHSPFYLKHHYPIVLFFCKNLHDLIHQMATDKKRDYIVDRMGLTLHQFHHSQKLLLQLSASDLQPEIKLNQSVMEIIN